jgi:PAS domain S-box-containing protein
MEDQHQAWVGGVAAHGGLLAQLFDRAPFGLHVLRADGTTVATNERFRTIVGDAPPAGYNLLRDPLPDRLGLREAIERIFRGEVVSLPARRYPLEALWSPGASVDTERVVAVTGLPLWAATGELSHVAFVVQDVTAEARAHEREEARRLEAEDARRWFETVIRQLPGGVVVAAIPSGEIRLANDQLAEILGHPILDSAEVSEYRRWGAIHADGTPYRADEHPLARAVSAQQVVEGEEVLYRRPDGSIRTLIVNATPIFGSDGEAHSAVASFIDITDRQRAEHIREMLAEAGRQLVSSLHPADTVRRVATLPIPLLADACFLHLADRGSVRQADVACRDERLRDALTRDVLYAADSRPARAVLAVMRNGEAIHLPDISDALLREAAVDDEHLAALQELGPRRAFIVPLPGRRGPLGTLTVVLTAEGRGFDALSRAKIREYAALAGVSLENGRLFQEAQQAVRDREQMLAAVSHDLRTPLSVIDTTSALLARGGGPSRDHAVDRIQRASRHMRRLIDDLVDLASLESGGLAIERGAVHAPALLEELRADYQPVAQETGCRVEQACDASAHEVQVAGDPFRVRQILGNLIDNAIKHSPRGEVVSLRAERTRDHLVFCVDDRGPGLDEHDRERVFQRYWRKQRTSHGAGLGLAIAKLLVEAQGGRIWVESEPGRGSSFCFTLPVLDA